jgi:membrane protease subunit HflK
MSGPGGPWDGRNPRTQMLDLEELLRRGQDRLRGMLPQGGPSRAAAVALVIALLSALWLAKAFYIVQPDELGQELVFGAPKQELSTPGLHFHYWPVETVETVTTAVRRELIGAVATVGEGAEASQMLSADQNILRVGFTVLWRVRDPKAYLFNVNDVEAVLQRVAESAMRDLVGRSTAAGVRTERRGEVEDRVHMLIQSMLDAYGAGVGIVGVQLEKADPPAEVVEAFEEVQRAQQDQERFQREAEADAYRRLGAARGEAAQITEAAHGYKARSVAEAEGESQRFLSVLGEYEQAESVTRKRLYLETMERVVRNSNKIIIDNGASGGVVPYLPLNQRQGN